MTKFLRIAQGLPPQTFPRRLRGWFVCGEALPWVRPKRHSWVESAGTEAPLLFCTRCTHQIGF